MEHIKKYIELQKRYKELWDENIVRIVTIKGTAKKLFIDDKCKVKDENGLPQAEERPYKYDKYILGPKYIEKAFIGDRGEVDKIDKKSLNDLKTNEIVRINKVIEKELNKYQGIEL